MAFILNDRVKETSTTTGTGAFTLGGAVSGFETFSAGIGGSNTTYYCIFHNGTTEFEVGFGTLNGGASTLTRTNIISSSNSDAAVDFSAGSKEVFCTVPGAKISLPKPEEYGSSSAPKIITVKVASKTAAHPYSGQGSGNAYYLNGLESPAITFSGADSSYKYYYRFDQSDSSNSGHPLRFYLEADKSTSYTTGVTTNGTAGSSGAYTQIAVDENTPNILYYQCSSHALMGNFSNVISNNINGNLTIGSQLRMPDNTSGKILIGDGTSYQESAVSGDATIASGGALTLANSGVSAASYTNSSITVDAKGRVTAASSGSAGASAGFAVAMAIAL
jgi:hypothetical protein